MAGTTTVIRSYPIADFPNDKCNAAILAQEIKDDPAVSVEPSVQQSGTTVTLQFAALITAAVPEPAPWAMAVAGLACSGWLVQRMWMTSFRRGDGR